MIAHSRFPVLEQTLRNYSARSYALAECCIYFTARFGGVHVFGYSSAESEPIWMKSGSLWVHCRGWPWQVLDAIRACSRDCLRAKRNFVFFCPVSNARFHRFPEIWTQHVDRCRDETFRNRILKSIQSHSLGLCTPYKKTPQIFCDVRHGLTTRLITLTSLNRWQPITITITISPASILSTIESRNTRLRQCGK